MDAPAGRSSVDLYWLPLGAGGRVVRWNGRAYEALAARLSHRVAADLYHSALSVTHRGNMHTIEMGPVWNIKAPLRGVVAVGPVGARWLGRFRLFRYEIRCWRDGRIPDITEAVDSPQRLSDDDARAARMLDLVSTAPLLTWGRDEMRTGDMWNSNSLVSWLLARTGHDTSVLAPPGHGRAPGWDAGLAIARDAGAATSPGAAPRPPRPGPRAPEVLPNAPPRGRNRVQNRTNPGRRQPASP
ncbi:hypothetical protein HT102_09475 [Hoyosella sp. G463]|uniref:Uncharacterized protein n=1 Tax=Lolliginicoccus lacisalsi TaxID=2742202 RepID=A0A927JDA2_9ACTN|nr:hypothetical protein [Lolliginicoccus lacisalsi]MBD8506715.1 hypothetical protein [Lolliginicoccus lacisalsi]